MRTKKLKTVHRKCSLTKLTGLNLDGGTGTISRKKISTGFSAGLVARELYSRFSNTASWFHTSLIWSLIICGVSRVTSCFLPGVVSLSLGRFALGSPPWLLSSNPSSLSSLLGRGGNSSLSCEKYFLRNNGYVNFVFPGKFFQNRPNKYLSRNMTKPTKWLCAQSDQSLPCPGEESLSP